MAWAGLTGQGILGCFGQGIDQIEKSTEQSNPLQQPDDPRFGWKGFSNKTSKNAFLTCIPPKLFLDQLVHGVNTQNIDESSYLRRVQWGHFKKSKAQIK